MSRPNLGTRTITCVQCNKDYTYNRGDRKGASATMCNVCKVTNRRKELKRLAVEYKGGKCIICGYNKSVEALDFHHLDPSEKSFGIGSKGYTRSWEKTKAELDKTVLVCANCHREIEAGVTVIE